MVLPPGYEDSLKRRWAEGVKAGVLKKVRDGVYEITNADKWKEMRDADNEDQPVHGDDKDS